jgi:pimeloyl-ACP methyl ester carboxylesterase
MMLAVDASDADGWTGTTFSQHLRDVSIRGRRLRYLDLGNGRPVVLVHGLGGSWQMWHRNIAELAVRHRVIAVDLPGFGQSEVIDPSSGIAGYARVLGELLDRLAIDQAVIVGHSLGGVVVQHLAVQRPETVAALVIVGSGDGALGPRRRAAFHGMALFSAALRRFGPPAPLQDVMLRALLSIAPVRHRVVARAVHDPSTVATDFPADMIGSVLRSPALADAIRAGLSNDVDASRISCPTLVVTGSRDRMVPPHCGQSLADRIPHAQFELWEDVGHHPMMERPLDFNRRLHTFSVDLRERPHGQ